jgi:predicted CxxxxCH...CXXCH cytochrome family protein
MKTELISLRGLRLRFGLLLLLIVSVATGCSTAESPNGSGSTMNHILPSGRSVSGWLVLPSGGSHASTATQDHIANGGSSGCTDCHGSDLSGGISNVSCFGNPAGCHHGPVANWEVSSPATQQHGVFAKRAPGNSGFVSCQICHGSDFSGGGANVSCFTCHGVSAPHPPKPWRASAGSLYDHVNTDNTNAPVCYGCHAYTGVPNPRNPHVPPTPAPSGTAPGCFNGTMCHNQAGHPAGWAATPPAGQPHGILAKMDGTVAGQGFQYCQTCHGANFVGGSVSVSCFTCHGVNAPHAPIPWRASAGSTYTHTTTVEAGNAPICYLCHAYTGSPNPRNPHVPPTPAPSGTAPGCFNGTMCHNETGHAVPFVTTTHTSVTSGTFAANCGSCHAVSGTSPVSGAPLCTVCHAAGSPLTALSCTSCHANPPSNASTSAYPNVAGAHAAHLSLNRAGSPVTCDTCHNGLGTGTLNHYNRANARSGKNALRVAPGDVVFPTTYSAKTGASSFDNSANLRCSNVRCHGGQATPNWQTGTITVNSQAGCTGCHASGTAQYNSYNSGTHGINTSHSNCLNCHNTTTLATNHFTTLSTTALEGPASATIGGGTTSISSGNYDTSTKSCSPSCHGTETW